MKFTTLKKFDAGDDIFSYKDYYIYVTPTKVSLLDKTTFEEKYKIDDYTDPDMAEVEDDYLITLMSQGILFAYDLKEKKKLFTYEFSSSFKPSPFGFTLDKERKYIYFIKVNEDDEQAEPNFEEMFSDGDIRIELTGSLYRVSIEDPTHDELILKGNFIGINGAAFIDGFILTDSKHKCQLFNPETKEINDLPFECKECPLAIDDINRLYFVTRGHGVRVFNEKYQEINLIDLASDTKISYPKGVLETLRKNVSNNFDPDSIDKEIISYVNPIKPGVLFSVILSRTGSGTKIVLSDSTTGKKLGEMNLYYRIKNAYTIDSNHFMFTFGDNSYLMEVDYE